MSAPPNNPKQDPTMSTLTTEQLIEELQARSEASVVLFTPIIRTDKSLFRYSGNRFTSMGMMVQAIVDNALLAYQAAHSPHEDADE